MSRGLEISCMTCKEILWIGQGHTLYSGEPDCMKALNAFLLRHETNLSGEHELMFHDDNWGWYEDDWKRIDWGSDLVPQGSEANTNLSEESERQPKENT